MDIVLDLWVHAIYNDGQVQGSELGPVVYFRNCTSSPLTNFSDLALRWGISKATVSRILNKLQDKEYPFTGIVHRQAWQRHLPVQLLIHHVQYQ